MIFQENVSFDHYFGTYPKAANTGGQPFHAQPGTPSVNGLSGTLLTANPNGVNPRRYDPANVNDVLTCDQDHNYNDEQQAFDGGKMDKLPADRRQRQRASRRTGATCVAGDVMNYYDGNTVTALWNYAQRYAMSDNSYSTTFGPSVAGRDQPRLRRHRRRRHDAHGEQPVDRNRRRRRTPTSPPDGQGGFSLTSDAQPYWDDCSTRDAVAMTGKNIGDELNAAGLSWGWFQGGFRPTTSLRRRARPRPGTPGSPPQRSSPTSSRAQVLPEPSARLRPGDLQRQCTRWAPG